MKTEQRQEPDDGELAGSRQNTPLPCDTEIPGEADPSIDKERTNGDQVLALMRIFRMFGRIMRKPGASGSKSGEMAVMATISFHQMENGEGIRITEIANHLKIAAPSVTQFVNSLEKTGWVERRMDPLDRRSVLVFLTEEGKRHHEHFEAHMRDMFAGLVDHLGSEDTLQLTRILGRTFTYFEAHAVRHHTKCPEHAEPSE